MAKRDKKIDESFFQTPEFLKLEKKTKKILRLYTWVCLVFSVIAFIITFSTPAETSVNIGMWAYGYNASNNLVVTVSPWGYVFIAIFINLLIVNFVLLFNFKVNNLTKYSRKCIKAKWYALTLLIIVFAFNIFQYIFFNLSYSTKTFAFNSNGSPTHKYILIIFDAIDTGVKHYTPNFLWIISGGIGLIIGLVLIILAIVNMYRSDNTYKEYKTLQKKEEKKIAGKRIIINNIIELGGKYEDNFKVTKTQ